MPRRLPVNSIRKIIQMYEANSEFSQNVLAEMCNCSRTAISTVINAMKLQGLTFKQIEKISDKELSRLVYPDKAAKKDKKQLDYEYLLIELKKPHVTKMTLWREYINANPNGYQKSQFIEELHSHLHTHKPYLESVFLELHYFYKVLYQIVYKLLYK